MQLCANCNHENPEGEMFCLKCGIALGAVSVTTREISENESPLSAGSFELAEDYIVLLHFTNLDDPIVLKLEQNLILGRTASDSEGTAINLEAYGATENGVSRRHARLTRNGNRLYICDLSSTNHTFLNGEKLIAERDYALRDGDEVRLGRMSFKVFFK
jgi:hypothetical protein